MTNTLLVDNQGKRPMGLAVDVRRLAVATSNQVSLQLLAVSKAVNPDCEHQLGDTGRTFL